MRETPSEDQRDRADQVRRERRPQQGAEAQRVGQRREDHLREREAPEGSASDPAHLLVGKHELVLEVEHDGAHRGEGDRCGDQGDAAAPEEALGVGGWAGVGWGHGVVLVGRPGQASPMWRSTSGGGGVPSGEGGVADVLEIVHAFRRGPEGGEGQVAHPVEEEGGRLERSSFRLLRVADVVADGVPLGAREVAEADARRGGAVTEASVRLAVEPHKAAPDQHAALLEGLVGRAHPLVDEVVGAHLARRGRAVVGGQDQVAQRGQRFELVGGRVAAPTVPRGRGGPDPRGRHARWGWSPGRDW